MRFVLVAAANETPEPDEEFLPLSNGTLGTDARVRAENFNPYHDQQGKFTSAGGAVRSGAKSATDAVSPGGHQGSGSGGGSQQPTSGDGGGHGGDDDDDNDDTDDDNNDKPLRPNPSKGGGSGGGQPTGKQKGGTQKPAHGTSQLGQSTVMLPSKGAGATGVRKPLPGVPQDGPLKGGNPGNVTPEGPIQKYLASKPYEGKLSSNPRKEDPVSGSCSPALAREAIAQVSKITGKEVLLPASGIAEAIQGLHSGSTRGLSDGSSHGASAVHDLVPILRKHQIACEDLSSKTTDGRSGINQIAAHLHNGPVLVAVSSGSNAHGESIMGQSKNGLYRVYNPARGGEDMLHASQIDPRGVIALSPSV